MSDDGMAEGLAKFTERLAEQTETDLRSTSGTVRRRRRVVRGSPGVVLPEDDGPEFVRVRSSAEETRTVARLAFDSENEELEEIEADSIEVVPDALTEEPIIPDQVTATTGNSRASNATRSALDATSAALLLDAVHSYIDGYDRLGADHPVTLDRLDRLRRATALADGN